MKYAHLADLHLGSWPDPKMRDLSTNTFLHALDQCIQDQVDFILFSGDLFNTSLPSLDTLKIVTKKLKQLKDKEIPLYIIAGSHDFSPSGKTMIDVLENAGLLKNVCKGVVNSETQQLQLFFTTDEKTGVKLTGVLGRKGQLDQKYYHSLDMAPLEKESGYKIFLFHTTVTEMLPTYLDKIESQPISSFPKGFDYYAGGHIHHPAKIDVLEYGTFTYPGALFPNNFSEVERYSHGGYYLITVNEIAQKVEWIPIKLMNHLSLIMDCSNKSPDMVTFDIIHYWETKEVRDSLVTIRLKGNLRQGRTSDVNFKEIIDLLYKKGAYFVMKSTSQLFSEEFEEIKISESSSPESIEEQMIQEHLQQIPLFNRETELQLTKMLLSALNTAKKEGETVPDFQKRIETEMSNLFLMTKPQEYNPKET